MANSHNRKGHPATQTRVLSRRRRVDHLWNGLLLGAERIFWEAEGAYTTAVGYAGGTTPNPTYEETCSGRTGHAEVVLVAFDTTKTSYQAMLRIFWEGHDPTQGMGQGNAWAPSTAR